MANTTNLYNKVVTISEEFLGPAGERFIRRQIETHFNIEPEQLKSKQLPELVDWTRLTFTMITNDSEVVNDFAGRLLKLANGSSVKTGRSVNSKN